MARMSFDGPRDDQTRPLPQGGSSPSPYGSGPGRQYPGAPPQPQQHAGTPTQEYPAAGVRADPAPTRQHPLAWQPTAAPPPGSGRPRRKGWRSPAVLIPSVLGVVVVLGAAAAFAVIKLRTPQLEAAPSDTPSATGSAAAMPAGRTWLSGAWTGGGLSAARIDAFGAWRGQPADVVTTYPAYNTWEELKTSDWHVGTLDGFKGRVSYGLPMLPKSDSGTLADVAAGKHDDVWQAVATILNKHQRGDAFVRIGLEANGDWFPWGSGVDQAADFKAAWRHIESVMKAVSPKLVFGFDITCGHVINGSTNRLDSLNKLYPGDDVVDVVGCDQYDQYNVTARNKSEWATALRPPDSAGLADVADFARAHKKKLAIPEWGVAATDSQGAGDNPYFIYSMYTYFQQNKDILAYEDYFNESGTSLGSAIWDAGTNPKAAAEYKKLWGAAPSLAG
jgi:Glycosyl hydrolase family 26